MYADRLIRLLKERVSDMSSVQKESLLSAFANSADLIVPTENNGVRVIPLDAIYYIRKVKKSVVIYTENESIEYSNKMDVFEYVESKDDSFKYLDNNLLVNLCKIHDYNSFYRKIYLLNSKELDVTGKAMENIVMKKLPKTNDRFYTYFGKVESV